MEETLNFPPVVLYAIPFFVLSVLIELVAWKMRAKSPAHKRDIRYNAADAGASLAMGLGNVAIGVAAGALALGAHFFFYDNRIITVPTVWWTLVIVFVLDDFCYYWFHRIAHERRWFWASHIVHHSSQHYNLTTALRQTWTGNLTLGFIFTLPLAFLGFHPLALAFVSGINLIYQFWIHTEVIGKFPKWFEAVMNTPSHHRVHHATNPRYLDANYAGVFITWDKMFGTFVEEDYAHPPRYGIVKNLGTFNPLKIAFHEWWGIIKDVAGARSVREVAGYMFGAPGWSPDGSRKTSAMIKAEWAKAQAVQPADDEAVVQPAE